MIIKTKKLLLKRVKNEFYPANKFSKSNHPNLEAVLEKAYKELSKKNESLNLDNFKILNLIEYLPHLVIELYEIIIRRFISRYCFNTNRHEDIYQDIVLDLLEKRFKYISKNFKETVDFSPYFISVIYNCCMDAQKKHYELKTSDIEDIQNDNLKIDAKDSENKLLIKNEIQKIEKCLYTINNKVMNYAFRYQHDLKVNRTEVRDVITGIAKWDVKTLWTAYLEHKNSLELFVKIYNKYKLKPYKLELFKKLLNKYLLDIARLMSSETKLTHKEAEEILIQYYELSQKEELENE